MAQPSEREIEIFNAALEVAPAERGAYLDQACAGDAALRQRVEELLKAVEEAGDFLESPAASPPAPGGAVILGSVSVEKPGDRIGRYKLLQQIGEGGCGVVYMAEQQEPVQRRVALKVIKLGMDTKSVIARFEAERQALALMDHPNIAKVLDAGATDTGRPYFVMELVRGLKITDYCDENNLSTQERLNLFIQVCKAIQHAHQKGIIHRDIKPSNILVTMNDGVPLPKVIDFGIAKATHGKLTDQTLFTAFEQFIGTPAYMSPEQTELSALDIDTRSDIYSLGVLLYELLTGRTPFDAKKLLQAGLDEIRRTIREQEPARPSTCLNTMQGADLTEIARHRKAEPPKLIHLVRGDLDWIVMKALEKDRSRRYETANGLASDIQRHLNSEPVVASPPSRFYRFQKMVCRNKLAFIAVSVVAASLIFGLGVATVAAFRIERDNRQIRKAKDDATEKLWASYLVEARAIRASGQAGRRFDGLDAVRKAAAIRNDLAVRNEAIACLAISDLRVSKEAILKGRAADDLVCYDLNLEKYAVGENNGSITVRAVPDDRVLAVLPAPGFSVVRIRRFSPDSRFMRVVYKREGENFSDWVWDVEKQKAVLKELPSGVPMGVPGDLAGNLAADFSPDSRLLARCQLDGMLSIYDLDSGKELKRLPGTRIFNNLILNPGSTRLACSSEAEPTVEIREVESGRKVLTLTCPARVVGIAWSADGKRLATACQDFRIYIWDIESSQRKAVLEGHDEYIINLAFNHAGSVLASASWDNIIRLWDTESGRQVARHPGQSWQLQFSPSDRQLLGWHNVAHYGSLEVAYGEELRRLHATRPEESTCWSGPEFSADGRVLAAGTGEAVSFWDVFSGKQVASLSLKGCDTHIFHPDGRSLILIDRLGGVRQRPLERTDNPGSFAYRLGKPRRFYDANWLRDSSLSRDGRYLAVPHEPEGESLILDLQNPSAKPMVLRRHPRVDRIAISPDGRWAATGSWNNYSFVGIWNAQSGDLVRTLPMPGRNWAAFSPDGRWLATSSSEYQLWEVGSWQPKGPARPGCAVSQWNFTAFSPDGRVMARTSEGHNIQLLETSSERPLAMLAPTAAAILRFQFSPDGSHLAAMQMDQQVQLWDLRLIREELAQMSLDWDMPPYNLIEKASAEKPVILEVEPEPASAAPAP